MVPRHNPDLIRSLRATLIALEQCGAVSVSDPLYQQLKRSVLLAIADLEGSEDEDNRAQSSAA